MPFRLQSGGRKLQTACALGLGRLALAYRNPSLKSPPQSLGRPSSLLSALLGTAVGEGLLLKSP